ncbi:UDP-2,4-diacetamido-2,4,6-trideoxy-beta-L-altropyranose hydrolase [Hymenobacter sp. BRD67]|uniref:UDP-2,4-diacetamido-2,4, 6-trideoxy-beta-L-altropyranose hydrolase n=1 Tax=Hymenobacter sp. BRD67 TaxID=2675877 RepID=UPI001565EEAC|nr:UDP-2,4-diacetamido-2,4,6-trideoxy-beta-L-altropyranose hydrolase [Hymenobacter sp. BRD67]QKG52777.1 UDP-2,4-diacetamido-2,4,6-trideoxy-beta-L-altropyranose hydrolase [Hymenobacter sp. BRD67]
MPRLVLRADGNSRIGLGHLMRLLALAEILRADFGEIHFLIQAPDENVQVLLRNAGLALTELPPAAPATEAAESMPALLQPTDVLVLDGYGFDYAYQQLVRPLAARLVCLDDLHAFPFAADLVLNPAGGVAPSAYLRPPTCRLLTGPGYAPLRADFQSAESQAASPSATQVLVCLGGADPRQLTRATAEVLLALPAVALVHVVVGSAYTAPDELYQWAATHPGRLRLHRALSAAELAALMRTCGAAVLSPALSATSTAP